MLLYLEFSALQATLNSRFGLVGASACILPRNNLRKRARFHHNFLRLFSVVLSRQAFDSVLLLAFDFTLISVFLDLGLGELHKLL